MQSKGVIRLVAILIALACIFQLSFTAATAVCESKAGKYAEKEAEKAMSLPSFEKVSDLDKTHYLDSIRKEANKFYIDSISSEKVFLGYTYKQIKEKEINLGLDLKGGMNVMLQLEMSELVKSMANDVVSPEFNQAIELAKSREKESKGDFITLFGEAWEEVAPGQKLYPSFNVANESKLRNGNKTTNEEVLDMLAAEAQSAIDNSYNVVEKRIDQFGVAQPNIQKIGNTGRILVELPGVKEPERVRKLLQGTASLGFWTTYDNQEVFQYLQEANSLAKELEIIQEAVVEEVVAEAPQTLADSLATELAAQNQSDEQFKRENPLFSRLAPSMSNTGQLSAGALVGLAHYRDTAKVGAILRDPQVQELFPTDLKFMWSFKPSKYVEGDSHYELVALRSSENMGEGSREEGPALSGTEIANADVTYDNMTGAPTVSMTMNRTGSNDWKILTGQNIGRQIAIVMDGMVYSYPVVNQEIPNGMSSISGDFTVAEAEDLATVLKSGKLSAPARIIQEQVVGPTLGSASIKSGLISFIIAFILVLIYMFVFYNKAGLVADIALLCNVLFLFGALTSFGAVLTLPGIAGLVLTMGMAVDANVIIYERVKEELRAGKALRLAITDGYKNAYSAIFDGQITTILTGIILYVFGSGPVRGFAAVLIIGIITSVFTSIFITRLIIDARVNKGKNVSFDRPATRNFLKNTNINFLSKRKITYIVSACLIVISLASIFTKGFTYGVDFVGGRTYVVRFDAPVTPEAVRAATMDEFGESLEVKQFGGAGQMKITTKYKVDDRDSEVDKEIEAKLFTALQPFFTNEITLEQFTSTLDNPNGIISSDRVDPTIASEIQRDAVIAVILALIVIFGYIAIRFSNWTWGIGGVASLAHTSIIVIGFFSLFSGILPFTLDVDQTFIAAILTIIGYAINDNVVIFDRIREYRALYPKRELNKNINDALNNTLSRTINTSVTTLVVLLSIAIFGGEVIRGFSVALILGVILGTYASIFIGTPIMYDLNIKREKKANK